MSRMLECPADDCDYTGLKSSVLGHYSGKTDGSHPGGYQKAKTLLSGQSSSTDTGSSSTGADRGSTSNPTMGSADPVNEPEPAADPAAADDDPGSDPDCPDCGSELYDFRQFAAGEYHEIAGTNVYVRGDFQCSSCGRWWVDE